MIIAGDIPGGLPAAATPDAIGWVPPRRLPRHEVIGYAKDVITLAFLLLALPWLLYKLVTDPGRVLRGAGRAHVSS